MRKESQPLSMLCMALFFISMNLGTVVAALSPNPFAVGITWAVYHYAGALCMALVLLPALPFWAMKLSAKKGVRALARPLPLCVLAIACLLLIKTVNPLPSLTFPDWISPLCLGIFWPLALAVFFSTEPPRRLGLSLSICMAAGDAVWVALQPFLSLVQPGLPAVEQTALIHTFQGVIQSGLGLCLGLGLAWHIAGARTYRRAGIHEGDSGHDGRKTRSGTLQLLALLFGAGLVFFTLYGLSIGTAFPKFTPMRLSHGGWHLALLATAPLSGLLMDRGGKGLILVAAFLALIAFTLPFVTFAHLDASPESLRGLLGIGRQTFLLALYVLLARLLRGSSLLPLFGSLGYALYLIQPLGALLGRACGGIPGGPAAAALALALIFAALLAFLASRLRSRPGVASPVHPEPPEETAPAPFLPPPGQPGGDGSSPSLAAARDKSPQAAFADAFGLTKREMEILDSLGQGMDIADVSLALKISERTVRFHVTGLLKKTSLPSRQRLLNFYAAWTPETRATPPPGA